MTTEQTDAHNASNGVIFETFCSRLDDTKDWEWATKEIEAMKFIKVDERVIEKCAQYLADFLAEPEEDVDARREEAEEYQRERHAQELDEHFAPSEGPRY